MKLQPKIADNQVVKVFFCLWQHVSMQRRKQCGILFILTIMSSLSEMTSLGLTLPFIGILTGQHKIYTYPLIGRFLTFFRVELGENILVPLAIAFGIFALVAGVLRLLLLWTTLYLGNAMGADLGIDMYRKTLYQPYSVHVARNSSEVISGITQKTSIATGVIVSGVIFLTSLFVFSGIMLSMLVIEPSVSMAAMLGFGTVYGLIAWSTRKRLIRNGQVIAQQQTAVMRSLQEGLGAVRDVLLDGTQEDYSNSYRRAALTLRRARTENTFINQAPRYAIEAVAIVLVVLFVLFVSYRDHGALDVLPILGFLALSAQRLLPLMQQLYGNWSEVAGNGAALMDVLALLSQSLPAEATQPAPIPLAFSREIRLHNLSFQYGHHTPIILEKINLVIYKGARLGIFGRTGGGKSTMLDILMGLLEPTDGALLVDGQIVNSKNRRAWQRTIAHVPQNIFLTDASITENIAFGVPLEQIDNLRVKDAAIRANAYEFIEKSPAGFETLVGERGVRLSGGQRQRIGIARALYKRASVLCFDEATSALDSDTENDVMNAIENLDKNLTIIIIAHRLTTLKNCTNFVKLENYQIRSFSSYAHVELDCC